MKKLILSYLFFTMLLSSGAQSLTNGKNTAINFNNDTKDWFAYKPTNTPEAGIIGMAGWLDAPAGKHGFLLQDGDDFRFEDGTKIKFWGTNHGNKTCGPTKENAEIWSAWYSKMGINGIRFHKFTYADRSGFGDPNYSSRLTDEGWDRLDYYMFQLRQNGIYYTWSPIYYNFLVDGDSSRVAAYSEIKTALNRRISGLVNFAPDLQDVLIELMVHLLDHRNPYTGLRYADDPALASVELQNEDNIFWTFARKLDVCPTYKAMLCKQYSNWLRKKYKTQEELVKRWGPNSLNLFPKSMTEEHLDKDNIYPITEFSAFSPEAISRSASPKRLFDNARFLYEVQEDFYGRYARAIRATGYKGPLVGSCWQAGSGVSHYYNLKSDYNVGIIDRHNYFGATPHSITKGPFKNASMFNYPGSGLISSGLMSVKDSPFVLSEWTVKMPTEWIADGPAIIGVYGLGLQDWDGSFHFASGGDGFSEKMEDPNVYNTNNLAQIGLFPALARMIYRNDVNEGKALPNRKVYIPSLATGEIGFKEQIRQEADIKQLGGDVPVDALMKGKLQLEFTKKPEKTILKGYKEILEEKTIVSNTRQLEWIREGNGCFSVNTEGTKAVCGFTNQKSFKLGDFEIQTESYYAMIFITSTEKDKKIKDSKSILITTVARVQNTGMKMVLNGKDGELIEKGTSPLLVEPVKATICYNAPVKFSVNVLDHDGLLTERSVKVENNTFKLDGATTNAIWYEIRMN